MRAGTQKVTTKPRSREGRGGGADESVLRSSAASPDEGRVYEPMTPLQTKECLSLRSLGRIAVANRRYAEAERYYTRALTECGQVADVHVDLGNMYWGLGLRTRAFDAYSAALASAPTSPTVCCAMARALNLADRAHEALALYNRVCAIDPSNADARRARARVLAATGDLERAVTEQALTRPLAVRTPLSLDAVATAVSRAVPEQPSAECAVSLVAGDSFARSDGVWVYARSLCRAFTGDKYMFVHGVSNDTTERFRAIGIRTIHLERLDVITRDRWALYYVLCARTPYRRIVVCDSKDVLVQLNPLDAIANDGRLLMVSEGAAITATAWNRDQQYGLLSSVAIEDACLNRDTINAGVQVGDTGPMRDLAALMYSAMTLAAPDCSDQAVLNFVYYSMLTLDRRFHVQAHMSTRLCVHGAAVRRDQDAGRSEATHDGRHVCHPKYGVFALVHQWDRTWFGPQCRAAQLG